MHVPKKMLFPAKSEKLNVYKVIILLMLIVYHVLHLSFVNLAKIN